MSNPNQPWGPGGPQGYGAPSENASGGAPAQPYGQPQPSYPQQPAYPPQAQNWGAAPQPPAQPPQGQGWGAPQPPAQPPPGQGWGAPPPSAPQGQPPFGAAPQGQPPFGASQGPTAPAWSTPGSQGAPSATQASSIGGQVANSMMGGAIRIVVGIVLVVLVGGGIAAKNAFSNRPNLVFLHNVRNAPATVTVNGAPSGSVNPTEVLQVPVEPGNYTVVSTFADGFTDTMVFTVPPREGMFDGFRGVVMLGPPFRYARVTVTYPSWGQRPMITPITLTPERFVRLPAGASRDAVNTGFPRSVTVRRGSRTSITHYCPIADDGRVPCLD